MGKTLIITEKPSVAREYAKVLGVNGKSDGYLFNDDYVICWCVGHLVTMAYPEKYDPELKKWSLDTLPFIPKEYMYEVIHDVQKQYQILSGFMKSKDIDTILYGGDSGREGEYIGRLVRKMSGVRHGIVEKRIWIDSFTEDEIRRGIREAKPLSDYDTLYYAAEERAIEDYSTGINFSRALSCRFGKEFNAMVRQDKYIAIAVGRVMSCVLGMVVRRELEIRNFKPTSFFKVNAVSMAPDLSLGWKVTDKSQYKDSPALYNDTGFKEEKDAQQFIALLPSAITITKNTKTPEKKKAPLLFNLAELQDTCTKRYKISPDETLTIAQSLYEKKLTTYPRTDARVISTAVAKEIDKNISGLKKVSAVADIAQEVLTNKMYTGIDKSQYTDDSKITDHYAIIPTGDTSALSSLDDLERNVYELICRRFLAIFYPAAVYTKYAIEAIAPHDGFESSFSTSTKVLADKGYLKVYNNEKDDKDDDKDDDDAAVSAKAKAIESLATGTKLDVNYNIDRGETTPPKRYTSGSMILAMENAGKLIEDEELRAQIKGCGIGTSATRAEIIAKLVRINYLSLNKKTQVLTPSVVGEAVYNIILPVLPELLNPEITAEWEKGLEDIRSGAMTKEAYENKIHDYVREGVAKVKGAKSDYVVPEGAKGAGGGGESIGPCPLCGGNMRETSWGFGCSNYKSDKTGCNFSIGTICEKKLTKSQAKDLLTKKKTGKITGFVSKKTGNKFDAALELKADGSIGFVFENNNNSKSSGGGNGNYSQKSNWKK